MANFIISEEQKSNILYLYFTDKNTMQQISEKTGISRYSISEILHKDKRFENEKKNRKEEKLQQPQINKVIFDKNGNSYSAKVSIPYKYIKKMGISLEDRLVEVSFDENKDEIVIKKYTKK